MFEATLGTPTVLAAILVLLETQLPSVLRWRRLARQDQLPPSDSLFTINDFQPNRGGPSFLPPAAIVYRRRHHRIAAENNISCRPPGPSKRARLSLQPASTL